MKPAHAARRLACIICAGPLLLVSTFALPGCASAPEVALHEIYDDAAQRIGADRNPVVVIPGILGSKLEASTSHRPIWGAFIYGAADADTAEGARLVALPMALGAPLSQLQDEIVSTEVLDTVTIDIAIIRGVEFAAYAEILKTLAAGRYRDRTLGESGAVDYAGQHYTCFQYPYDWRRDISEQALSLHALVMDAKAAAAESGQGDDQKVDVVAHSMGGLVLRYYLRYGPHPLPNDGSPPELTWEGARHIENAIVIGTPNAGSVLAMRQLIEGARFAPLITPSYRPAVLGTMPAIYQLLPRPRHARVVDEAGAPIDFLDPAVWQRYAWGLADPAQDRVLAQLLPEVDSSERRREIALDHLSKCLARTRQLFDALDSPATPPPGCRLFLIAGDAVPTPSVLTVHPESGGVMIHDYAPGDGTVTRASALMDERTGRPYAPRLRSPITWSGVQFLESDHIGLTRDRAFSDFVLYTLLEQPRDGLTIEMD